MYAYINVKTCNMRTGYFFRQPEEIRSRFEINFYLRKECWTVAFT